MDWKNFELKSDCLVLRCSTRLRARRGGRAGEGYPVEDASDRGPGREERRVARHRLEHVQAAVAHAPDPNACGVHR